MLINALCDYYDILAKAGKVLPEGYSHVPVNYLVSLTKDGIVDAVINCQEREEIEAKDGKKREDLAPKRMTMPQRTEKTWIDANIIEHRPLYIFGLNFDNGIFSPDDRTGKAKKSHDAFVKENQDFLDGLESPVICAFQQFLMKWKPEEETKNAWLMGLGKEYGESGFAFCLSGYPDRLLHEEPQVKKRWEDRFKKIQAGTEKACIAQCAVSGERTSIARIHNKIKGVYGGLATGSVLIGFNNPSENSYGNKQSYNSNISQAAMKRYTEALNYLLGNKAHKILLDDITLVFWAMNANEMYEDVIMAMLCGESEKLNAEQTQYMLEGLLKDGRKGRITEERLQSLGVIEPTVEFYMAGLKPNSSRLAVKFIYRRQYADVLWNMAQFQEDLQIAKKLKPISLERIKRELTSPKSKNEMANPSVLTKLFEAVLYGSRLPTALLETVVRRVKIDADREVNRVRAGIIKACINRNYKKGEIGVALDRENHTPAYLCGRLFAVLERLQQEASNHPLNRTIKDAYFASASSKPAIVFPKLLKLAQNHLNKVKNPAYYNRLIGEIIEPLAGEFPETHLLVEQGRFIVGYYQQYQKFFEKREKEQNAEMEDNENGNQEQI